MVKVKVVYSNKLSAFPLKLCRNKTLANSTFWNWNPTKKTQKINFLDKIRLISAYPNTLFPFERKLRFKIIFRKTIEIPFVSVLCIAILCILYKLSYCTTVFLCVLLTCSVFKEIFESSFQWCSFLLAEVLKVLGFLAF